MGPTCLISPNPSTRLIDELKHLPGIGQKTAQRLAFHLLRADREEALALADAIRDAKDEHPRMLGVQQHHRRRSVPLLHQRHAQSQNDLRRRRSRTTSWPSKRRASIGGLYHVLGGALSPLQGIGPDQLKLKSLIERLKGGTVEEIIIATNPTAEGEATAVYLSKLIKPLGVRVTRIASASRSAPTSNTPTKSP